MYSLTCYSHIKILCFPILRRKTNCAPGNGVLLVPPPLPPPPILYPFSLRPSENRKTVKYGIEPISNKSPFLRTNVPNEHKLATSLHGFKLKMKN